MPHFPSRAEAELVRNIVSLAHQAGPAGAPPEILELIREHVNREIAAALEQDRKRRGPQNTGA